MDDKTLYKQLESAKEVTRLLLENSKEVRETYLSSKGQIKAVFEEALNENTKLDRKVTDYCLANAKGGVLDRTEFNEYLRETYEEIPELAIHRNMERAYKETLIDGIAKDLELMKRIRDTKVRKPTIGYQALMSEKKFKEASLLAGDKYAYEAYFLTDPHNRDFGGEMVQAANTSWSPWKCPIKRTWYAKVYLQGLAVTDIAGKAVMTLDADPLSRVESHKVMTEYERDDYTIYRAKVGYAKYSDKGRVSNPRILKLKVGQGHSVSSTPEEMKDINGEEWYKTLTSSGFELRERQEFKDRDNRLQNAWMHSKNPYGCVIFRIHSDVNFTDEFIVAYKEYCSGTVGFVEERYIAAYQDRSTMSKPKIACGTTPGRSMSVLRNRITKDVAKTMGVV